MDRTDAIAEGRCADPGTLRDDLGANRHCRLFRRTRADIETDGSHDPSDAIGVYALGTQPFNATIVGAPRAHGAEITDPSVQRANERRDVELVVVGEHADGVPRAQS